MISTTMGMPYTQINQSVKIESRKETSKNTPYFFTIIKESQKIKDAKQVKKEKKKIKK